MSLTKENLSKLYLGLKNHVTVNLCLEMLNFHLPYTNYIILNNENVLNVFFVKTYVDDKKIKDKNIFYYHIFVSTDEFNFENEFFNNEDMFLVINGNLFKIIEIYSYQYYDNSIELKMKVESL